MADTARPLIIISLIYVVAVCDLSHIIAGSAEVLYGVFEGTVTWNTYLLAFFVPTLIGNTIGGISLVALINHAQVATEAQSDVRNELYSGR